MIVSHLFMNLSKKHADLKYVESLEDEIDELESDKAEFSNMYDMLLHECVSNDIMCSYLQSLSDLDEITELQCLYLHKVRECDCLAQKLSEQTEFVSKEIYTELLRSFAKLEKHSISLEIALQQCQEQLKNDTVCKEKASNVFRKEREQYFEIQDLKAQLQDKNIAISELKKLIEKCKGKSVDTKFDKPSVVRQPNAQRIPKPSVLGKPAPFSDSLERKYFAKKKSICSLVKVSKAKRQSSFKSRPVQVQKAVLNLLHMEFLMCPLRVKHKWKEIFSGIVDDYSSYTRFDEFKEMSETSVANDTSGLIQPVPSTTRVRTSFWSFVTMNVFNDGTSRVNESSSPTDDSTQQDTLYSTNIHPTSEPSTPTIVHAEENNDNQAEFTNPFCTPVQEIAESSSRNIALTVSIVDTRKNIKESMADSAWMKQCRKNFISLNDYKSGNSLTNPLARTNGYDRKNVLISKNHCPVARLGRLSGIFIAYVAQ
ncbi:hypothetical protein Tco_0780997 [Tanacetum coccineum]